MNAMTLHDAFVGAGCEGRAEPQPAVSVEPGAIWRQAYDAVTTKGGRYVQGGGCMTVGVAGLILGGGFGSFSKAYGMAGANLIEAEIVTADGEVKIANACSNPDLFWALKGGGGGFGVVTRVTLRTHALPEYFGGVFVTVHATSDDAYRRLIAKALEFYARGSFQSSLGRTDPHSGRASSQFRWSSRASISSRRRRRGSRSSIGSPLRRRISPSWRRPRSARCERGISGTRRFSPAFPVSSLPTIGRARRRTTSSGPATSTRRERSGTPTSPPGCRLRCSKPTGAKASQMRCLRRRSIRSVSLHCNKGLAGATAEAIAAAKDTATNPAVTEAFALLITGALGEPAYPGVPGHEPDLRRPSAERRRLRPR